MSANKITSGVLTGVDLNTGVNIGMESYSVTQELDGVTFNSTSNIFGVNGFSQKITACFTEAWIPISLHVQASKGVELKADYNIENKSVQIKTDSDSVKEFFYSGIGQSPYLVINGSFNFPYFLSKRYDVRSLDTLTIRLIPNGLFEMKREAGTNLFTGLLSIDLFKTSISLNFNDAGDINEYSFIEQKILIKHKVNTFQRHV